MCVPIIIPESSRIAKPVHCIPRQLSIYICTDGSTDVIDDGSGPEETCGESQCACFDGAGGDDEVRPDGAVGEI